MKDRIGLANQPFIQQMISNPILQWYDGYLYDAISVRVGHGRTGIQIVPKISPSIHAKYQNSEKAKNRYTK